LANLQGKSTNIPGELLDQLEEWTFWRWDLHLALGAKVAGHAPMRMRGLGFKDIGFIR
jgi:hypothetical protein